MSDYTVSKFGSGEVRNQDGTVLDGVKLYKVQGKVNGQTMVTPFMVSDELLEDKDAFEQFCRRIWEGMNK